MTFSWTTSFLSDASIVKVRAGRCQLAARDLQIAPPPADTGGPGATMEAGGSMVRVGTSGWHYKHWRGKFYPEKFPASRMLEFYIERFDTVELNNTFYKLPTQGALEAWRRSVPAGFRFAVKASRFITHMKKLKDPESSFQRFFDRVVALGIKLGPVLFQLPPRWGADAARLEEFLAALPRKLRYAFELRDPSWFQPEVEAILRRHRAAFCIYDIDRFLSPMTVTTDLVYVRLHGPDGKYAGSYSDEQLRDWARRFRDWEVEGREVYCYFDNDQAGYAARNALRLKQLLSGGIT